MQLYPKQHFDFWRDESQVVVTLSVVLLSYTSRARQHSGATIVQQLNSQLASENTIQLGSMLWVMQLFAAVQ